jgi:hypothetical protein
MKKILITLTGAFALMFSANAQEQFNNSGFETGNLSGWNVLSIMGMDVAPGSVSRSSDSHSGAYALKLTPAGFNPILLSALELSGQLPDSIKTMLQTMQVPAVVTNGNIDALSLIGALGGGDEIDITTIGNAVADGLNVSSTPVRVDGYMSFESNNSADAYAIAVLGYTGTGNNRHVTALGALNSPSMGKSATYQSFSIDITALEPTTTEVILIAVSMSSDTTSTPTLLIDDLTIFYTNGLSEGVTLGSEIGIYPNPNNGTFSVNGCGNGVKVVVTNMLGQELLTIENYRSGTPFSIDKKGMYFVQVENAGKQITKKVIVK